MVTADELADLRAEQTAALDRPCAVRTVTLGAGDAAGGFGADTTSDAAVACRIATLSAQERQIADRLGIDADAMVTLPYGTAVAQTAAIIDQATGRTYHVARVNDGDSYQAATRVYAKRIG